jgi:hypothetical protein
MPFLATPANYLVLDRCDKLCSVKYALYMCYRVHVPNLENTLASHEFSPAEEACLIRIRYT